MKISIGILAWNEENVIGDTLRSLFSQSIFDSASVDRYGIEWEIIVVPNGCTDTTAAVAISTLESLVSAKPLGNVQWKVYEVVEVGKSNSWNVFVHDLSNKSADYMLMIDADIMFGERETIENTLAAMLHNPQVKVVVDQPLKDVVRKSKLSVIERLSLAGTNRGRSNNTAIAGSFYLAKADILRNIWIPRGLIGEDGFVKAMILTDLFRGPLDESKIIQAENASHYFETLTDVRKIFQHEVRIVMGSALNCYLTWDFLKFATDPNGPGAGILIRNNMLSNSNWYIELIANSIRNRGLWVLPRGMLTRKLRYKWRTQGDLVSTLKNFAFSLAAFAFDVPVMLVANHKLKRRLAVGYW